MNYFSLSHGLRGVAVDENSDSGVILLETAQNHDAQVAVVTNINGFNEQFPSATPDEKRAVATAFLTLHGASQDNRGRLLSRLVVVY